MVLSAFASAENKKVSLAELARVVGEAIKQIVPDPLHQRQSLTSRQGDAANTLQMDSAAAIIPFIRGTPRPRGVVPLYSLKIAAGPFGEEDDAPEPEAWVKTSRKGDLSAYFAAYVRGRSMEPLIPDGALCLFHRQLGGVAGSRQGRVVLARHRMIDDPEAGGAFTVKRYKRVTLLVEDEFREKVVVHLLPENPEFKPIVLETSPDDPLTFVAEFVHVLSEK
jgi:SOS-response transcriptional repressor LexA